MNYKNLLCLVPLLFSTLLLFSQTASQMLTNLDACPDKLLPYPNAPEDELREKLVTDVLKLTMEQFNNFQKDDIDVYLRSLVIKSKDYNTDSELLDLTNFSAEDCLCKLYKWYLITEQLHSRHEELVYNLERELHLKPIYQLQGEITMRIWYFDTADNFYNVFDLVQKESNTLKADYLKVMRDEKGIFLDDFNPNIATKGVDSEAIAKIKELNFKRGTDQSRLPFFLLPEDEGNVVVIQFRTKEEKHFFYYRDLEDFAKKERHSITHRNAMKLLDLIETNYGVSIIPKEEVE